MRLFCIAGGEHTNLFFSCVYPQYLRRPAEENENYRLDRLLERKARQGVMIYIVIYKEIELALPLHSEHTKQWLQGRHRNIFGG
jgi:hypothetical protein